MNVTLTEFKRFLYVVELNVLISTLLCCCLIYTAQVVDFTLRRTFCFWLLPFFKDNLWWQRYFFVLLCFGIFRNILFVWFTVVFVCLSFFQFIYLLRSRLELSDGVSNVVLILWSTLLNISTFHSPDFDYHQPSVYFFFTNVFFLSFSLLPFR